eukprot:60477-Chlamydomonas_euryale.AAC.2
MNAGGDTRSAAQDSTPPCSSLPCPHRLDHKPLADVLVATLGERPTTAVAAASAADLDTARNART